MKKAIKYSTLGLILLVSCAKDVEVCVDGNMHPDAPGSYTYTWCGSNADHVEWQTSWGDGSYAGESVTFDFDYKSTFSFTVSGYNDKRDAQQNFQVVVGNYEARVEPVNCSGESMTAGNLNLKAYAYLSTSDLNMDLANGNMSNCVDSLELELDNFYNNALNNQDALVAGFTSLVQGTYVIYVTSDDHQTNNLQCLQYSLSSSTINVTNGESDDIVHPIMDESAGAFYHLLTNNYLLTAVSINGTPTTVPACNADDVLSFNLDGTFVQDVGSDDCSGGQITSTGTYQTYMCTDFSSATTYLTADSGSWSGLTVYMTVSVNANILTVTAYDGTNTLVETFTAQ